MERLASKTVFHEINLREQTIVELENEDDPEIHDSDADDTELLPEPEARFVNSEDEWDTDLEEEGRSYTRRRYIEEDPARQVYLAACRRLNIVPANCFIKGIDTQTVNLNFQGLGPLGTRAVATGLVKDKSTVNLFLSGNFIGDDGVKYLAQMLRDNDVITHLDLSENNLSTYAAEVITDIFKDNDTLTVLKLSSNKFKGEDAFYFASVLTMPHYIGLRELDLSHNEFGDTGAKILGHAIGDNETLTTLNLSWNQIRKPGIQCIAKGLAENNCIKTFDLSSNGVDSEAAELLGKALVQNRKLEDLNLNSNRVGFNGIAALFKHIGKNENLHTLRLTNNPITLQGPVAALTLLQKSEISVLQEFEIADACVPREFFRVLEEVQQAKPKFKVHLGGFMDSKDMCKAEVKTNQDAWKKDPVLVFINFIDERKYKLLDMFKSFDSDRSSTLSRKEFKTGLIRVGCQLKEKELEHLIDTLDIDQNGEIDIGEFLDGFEKHKRRLNKWNGRNSQMSSASSRPSPTSSEPSSAAPSRPSSRGQENQPFLDVPNQNVNQNDRYNKDIETQDIMLSVPKGRTVL